jgi:PAS domain S-box-containing protein
VGRDVTLRKLAEEELRSHRAFLRLIIDTVPNLIFVKNREGRFILVNKAMAEMYGTTVDELEGRFGADFNAQQDELTVFRAEDLEVLDSEQAIFIPQRVVTNADGAQHWYATTKLPLPGNDHVLGVAVDITERKLAEAERAKMEKHFRQAQKMQALGTLAGGIAHDFNNMIFAILGFVRLALKQAESGSKSEEYLQQIQSAGLRASELVRQILTFSRQTEQDKKPVHVAGLFKEISKMLRATLPPSLSIEMEVEDAIQHSLQEEGPPQDVILGDPIQVHQVIMNLCTNAAHAMGETGGTLCLRLRTAEIDKDQARGLLEQNPGDYLEISISDTGHGIEPSIIEQIYDPFFTTKPPGEGTGMGLAVVHGIVKSHGGSVSVTSQVGKGTTFTVLLPKLTENEKEQTEAVRQIPTGNEHILFVDDEGLLVQMVGEMLAQLGYRVTARTNPREALELFLANPDDFHLVITDQTMPDLTGIELSRAILEARPEMPIILLTGYSEAASQEKATQLGIEELIMKPVVEEQIAQAIRHVLDRRT